MIRKDLADNVCQRFFPLLLIKGWGFFLECLDLLDYVPKIVVDVVETICIERKETFVVPMMATMMFMVMVVR